MFVIGNGESRLRIDLHKLKSETIGCNAIIRDFTVGRLVCVDRRMVQEAISREYRNAIYTRADWAPQFVCHDNVLKVPSLPYEGTARWDDPFQWGSGPYAVLLGAKYCKGTCNLIGFDLHSQTKTVNNVYKGTKNYDPADKRPVDPRYWVHQIGKVFEHFPKIQFTIYQEPHWELPQAWKYPNVMVDNISNINYNI